MSSITCENVIYTKQFKGHEHPVDKYKTRESSTWRSGDY